MIRAKAILLLAFTIGICLTGCKKEAPDENQRLTIAVIPKGTIHEFWKTVHAGADMAGRELDVDILWKGIKGGKRLKKIKKNGQKTSPKPRRQNNCPVKSFKDVV